VIAYIVQKLKTCLSTTQLTLVASTATQISGGTVALAGFTAAPSQKRAGIFITNNDAAATIYFLTTSSVTATFFMLELGPGQSDWFGADGSAPLYAYSTGTPKLTIVEWQG
jgi:hypothetical protein